MTKNKSTNRKKRFLIFICVVAVIVLLITGANVISVNNLLKKGDSYGRVQTEDRLVPQKDSNGKICSRKQGMEFKYAKRNYRSL